MFAAPGTSGAGEPVSKVPRPMSAQPEVKTEVTDLPESKVKIAATVPSAELDKRLQSAARSFASEMKVPGFRKGKVPPQLVL